MISIFQDTREKNPLCFDKISYIDSVTVTKLPYGDYASKFGDIKIPIIFERKSLSDLCGTLGKDFDRFRKEIDRANEDKVKLIIIVEVDLLKILQGYKRSKMSGIGMIRTLFTLYIKYHIPFVTCRNRDEMSLYISEFFYSYIKNQGK